MEAQLKLSRWLGGEAFPNSELALLTTIGLGDDFSHFGLHAESKQR